MTINEIIAKADFPGASVEVLERILALQESGLNVMADGRVWFVGIPVPLRYGFDSLRLALEFAFSLFPDGATIEQLRRVLCLSTDGGVPITRMAISSGLAANSDMFVSIQRGKWTLAANVVDEETPPPGHPVPTVAEGEEFNAEVFFGGAFAFAEE
jgi:hypothetical protein